MSIFTRARRHARLSLRARRESGAGTPPFLILFINSICNLTCEHCFYWQNLNRRDDLTFEEIEKLSRELGPIENLNLSGGEPFLRPEFAEIVKLFLTNNGAKQVYVPTNGYFPEKTEKALRELLKESALELFACELSLDGMPDYHDKFRGNPKSFAKAMETYAMLAELQKEDARVRIHAISTATHENMDSIRALTDLLHEQCPSMDHHNLAIIRGDRKNPGLLGPNLAKYRDLSDHVRWRWRDREEGRFGSIVEPLLQWAKTSTVEAQKQVIPCKAGILSGVVYANGDVSVCETHAPLGNLRQKSFRELWASAEAQTLRKNIKDGACWCSNEVFLWPSIAFQPWSLTRSILNARPWRTPKAPAPHEV